MEAILFVFVLVLIILQAITLGRMGGLGSEIRHLREQLAEHLRGIVKPSAPTEPVQRTTEHVAVVPPPAAMPPTKVEPSMPVEDAAARMRAAFPGSGATTPPLATPPPLPPPVIAPPPRYVPPPPRPTFFQRHPDLEKFIGENLINKIGIAVLVLGIGLLLNYAIGKGLLNTTAQTLIGLGAGGLLVFFAHRLRLNFRAFSSVLVAGGIAIFYTTIAIAFHKFGLIGQIPAFIIMIGITALAVALTLGYDRKELAVISLLGGFAAPFLASSGDGNYKVLFTYLLILDVGMLVLANYKKWYVINVLAFGLTALIMARWAITNYASLEQPPALIAFAFATAFFLVFFAMNLRFNLRHKQVFSALDHTLLLVNTAAYYAAGMHFLSDLSTRVTGLFTALIGLFYLLFALYFHKKEGVPNTLKMLLIGLVLTFISLAAPVQLQGSYITLFWAAEAVLLLWFAHRTSLRLVERASMLVLVLMAISLYMDLFDVYVHPFGWELRVVLNKGWITGMAGAASFAGTVWLLRRSDGTVRMAMGITRAGWCKMATVAGLLVLYAVNLLELREQLVRVVDPSVIGLASTAWTLLFLIAVERTMRRGAAQQALFLLFVIIGAWYITGHYHISRSALWHHINVPEAQGFVVVHVIAFALMVIIVVRIAMLARKLIIRPSSGWNTYLWFISIFLVVLASQELDHAMVLGQGDAGALTDARRVGYPILWGVGSFLFMWYGMRQRMRIMRVIALCLFAVTLLKLFLIDLRNLSEGGRVAAFIFLGALLLVISFMYQKLKGLFVDDAPKNIADDAGPQA